MIEKIVAELAEPIVQKEIEVRIDITSDVTIYADENVITMVFENIIANAVNYNKRGGKVHISAATRQKDTRIVIVDTGIGIKPQEQKNMFSIFYRSEDALRLRTGGTGIGLYIAKRIVLAHGGKIWFESTYHKGTTFYISLPKSEKGKNRK